MLLSIRHERVKMIAASHTFDRPTIALPYMARLFAGQFFLDPASRCSTKAGLAAVKAWGQ